MFKLYFALEFDAMEKGKTDFYKNHAYHTERSIIPHTHTYTFRNISWLELQWATDFIKRNILEGKIVKKK
jgi:hypothetical protein